MDVETSTRIARPRHVVAAYAVDPATTTTWYANIDAVDRLTPPPLAVGSELAFRATFLGRRLEYTYRVTAYEPGELFVMSTAQGPFPMETTYRWADLDDGGTLMHLRNRGEPTGFAGVAAPLLAAGVRRANRKDLARLKQLLESEPR